MGVFKNNQPGHGAASQLDLSSGRALLGSVGRERSRDRPACAEGRERWDRYCWPPVP